MDYRKLGELEVSAVGLGCLGMSGGYGAASADDCVATIRKGLELGLTLLDTADFYGAGANEELVGRAVSGRRADVVLATRGGLRSAEPGGPPVITDGRPAYLREACDASLRRLGVDHIDLYYLGRPDPDVPIEESVGGLASLVADGKIGHIGLSEVSADQLRRGHAEHPITALESEYSLWERHVEAEILPAAASLGVGLVAHTPLGKGMLSGELRAVEFAPGDFRRNHPRFDTANFAHNHALIETARAAFPSDVPFATLALAWLLSRGPGVVPIPGTRRIAHLTSNLAAADLALDAATVDRLSALVPPSAVRGSRARAPRPT
ncbi:Predicted oxidoreductase [Amycolatopsis xylanica]|uniref:Predicted oxidoreductase n=1 Tax=Amycolatopsis xylanica TaxID=589385 RepID=A0A1H2VTB2_9PSEU|nr:aldo/keto reductase [Amycolatopsis xylanica]SDW71194.1 Predicted oxidoreductase [Amycolatopsis xylanica]